MKSIIIVNPWGLFTHSRSSLSLFIFEAIRNIRLWNVLMAAKLIEQYGREEVRVITDANIHRRSGPSYGDAMGDLFKTGSRTC